MSTHKLAANTDGQEFHGNLMHYFYFFAIIGEEKRKMNKKIVIFIEKKKTLIATLSFAIQKI